MLFHLQGMCCCDVRRIIHFMACRLSAQKLNKMCKKICGKRQQEGFAPTWRMHYRLEMSCTVEGSYTWPPCPVSNSRLVTACGVVSRNVPNFMSLRGSVPNRQVRAGNKVSLCCVSIPLWPECHGLPYLESRTGCMSPLAF